MHTLSKKIEDMFSTPRGEAIYECIIDFIKENKMDLLMEQGLLLGFSGGADSCMLASFLYEYSRRSKKQIPLFAVHVNHMIRGEEADRDEAFSIDFLNQLDIPFKAVKIDIPYISKNLGIGLEETARNERYKVFADIIKGRNNISYIAVAHNATDNMETVIFNILRGAGISGVSGIKPVRDNIIRPLLSISKGDITALLDDSNIQYVTDSTNFDTDYSRNYIRNKINPKLEKLSPIPENAFSRMSKNLRRDVDYLDKEAEAVLSNIDNLHFDISAVRELHPAIFARVISKIIFNATNEYPTEKHINSIAKMLHSDNFSISLTGEYNLICNYGLCTFVKKKNTNPLKDKIFPLKMGINEIENTNLTVFIGDDEKFSSNVYNFSIKAYISSAIIDGSLFVRFKKDGDSYKYFGLTHKLKKVFNDRKIPVYKRALIPLLCDNKGIVWIPGLNVADRAVEKDKNNAIKIIFAYSNSRDDGTSLCHVTDNSLNNNK